MATSRRLKVKLFHSDERVHLTDTAVSKWIESNPNIEIQEVKVIGAGSNNAHFMVTITYLE